jgi:hypothetical protein
MKLDYSRFLTCNITLLVAVAIVLLFFSGLGSAPFHAWGRLPLSPLVDAG